MFDELQIPGPDVPPLKVGFNEVNRLTSDELKRFEEGRALGRFELVHEDTMVLPCATARHITAETLSRMSPDEWQRAQEHIKSGRFVLCDRLPNPTEEEVEGGKAKLAVLPDGSVEWFIGAALPSDAADITPSSPVGISLALRDPADWKARCERKMQAKLDALEAEIAQSKARLET